MNLIPGCTGKFIPDMLNLPKSWKTSFHESLIEDTLIMFQCAHCTTFSAMTDLNSFEFPSQQCPVCLELTCTDCGAAEHGFKPCKKATSSEKTPEIPKDPRDVLECAHCHTIGAVDKSACLKSTCPKCKKNTCACCGVGLNSFGDEHHLYDTHFCRALASDPISKSCKHTKDQPHCYLWPSCKAAENANENFGRMHPELVPEQKQTPCPKCGINNPPRDSQPWNNCFNCGWVWCQNCNKILTYFPGQSEKFVEELAFKCLLTCLK
jgi:hypothetical protein